MCEFCTIAFKSLFYVSVPNFSVTDCDYILNIYACTLWVRLLSSGYAES